MQRFINETFNIGDELAIAEAVAKLDVCKQKVLGNWDKYANIGDARFNKEKTIAKLNFIFDGFGRTASTQSIYQLVSCQNNRVMIRLTNHDAAERNLKRQIKAIPSIVIWDFNFLDSKDNMLDPEEIVANTSNGTVKGLHNVVIINKKHLNPQKDVASFIDSLKNLINTETYVHPFMQKASYMRNLIRGLVLETAHNTCRKKGRTTVRLTESQFRNVITEAVRGVLREWSDYPEYGEGVKQIDNFRQGYALVKDLPKQKYNFVNTNRELLSEEWFDYALGFNEGFAPIFIKDKGWNYIDTYGDILTETWYGFTDPFNNGFGIVMLRGKYNFVDRDGQTLCGQWFDKVHPFEHGRAVVERRDGKENFIDEQGDIVSEQWFDHLFYFALDWTAWIGNMKYRIDRMGNIMYCLGE